MTFQISTSRIRPSHPSITKSGGTPPLMVLKIATSVDPWSQWASVKFAGVYPSGAAPPSPAPEAPWQDLQNLPYTFSPAATDAADVAAPAAPPPRRAPEAPCRDFHNLPYTFAPAATDAAVCATGFFVGAAA